MLAAERGELAAWESTPRRRLALILLLDQFPRHVHRGTPLAFAHDHAALSLALIGLQFGADAALHPIERVFFYTPLMHAEAIEVQEESVGRVPPAAQRVPAELADVLERSLDTRCCTRISCAASGAFRIETGSWAARAAMRKPALARAHRRALRPVGRPARRVSRIRGPPAPAP